VIGNSVATLVETCVRAAFSSVCGMWNAASRNQIVRMRRLQSAACQIATRRRYSVGGERTRNACATRSRKSAT
jgi:hypothetical protein